MKLWIKLEMLRVGRYVKENIGRSLRNILNAHCLEGRKNTRQISCLDDTENAKDTSLLDRQSWWWGVCFRRE